MSPNFRCLQHKWLHLRYVSELLMSPAISRCLLRRCHPKHDPAAHRFPFVCGIIARVHVKLETAFVFLSVLQFSLVKRGMEKVALCLGHTGSFQRSWEYNTFYDFCYTSSSGRTGHETPWIDFKWRQVISENCQPEFRERKKQ